MDPLAKEDRRRAPAIHTSRYPAKFGALLRLQEALRQERFELCTEALDDAREFGATNHDIEKTLFDFLKKS